METKVKLIYLRPNPWQARIDENIAHVRKIADSILRSGLHQAPVGRLATREGEMVGIEAITTFAAGDWDKVFEIGTRVQLAFGNTRLAAFRLLDSEHPGQGYDCMPIVLRDLSNLEMFEHGIEENVARKELDPIEEALAMERYREEFGKTSIEIGALFGSLSDSAVRNKIRLLKLPDNIRADVRSGEITEGAARALIALYEVPKDIRQAAGEQDESLSPWAIIEAARSGASPKSIAEQVQQFINRLSVRPAAVPAPQPAPVPARTEPVRPSPAPSQYTPPGLVKHQAEAERPAPAPQPVPAPVAIPLPEEPAETPDETTPVTAPAEELVAAPEPARAPAGPSWEMSTVTLTLTYWPGAEGTRMVALGARVNQGAPLMRMSAEGALELPQALADLVNELKSQFGE